MEWDLGNFINLLQAQAGNPFIIMGLIIIATFILEDPATVGAALVAVEGLIDPYLALIALYIGIFVGDLGLYGLGRLSSKYWRVRDFLKRKGMVATSNWLDGWMVQAIIGARFAPGMRLPTYTACGLFRLSFTKFALTTGIAVFFWTSALFAVSYLAGEFVVMQLGEWRWAIGIGLVVATIFLPRLLKKLTKNMAFVTKQKAMTNN
ncbi:DedA family protein [Curvivirga sp.]|uniref:DedA family protein n=1 Tax=Curvivirga sp. TaxID=2856848 RepID=UPI003B5BB079